MIGQKKLQTRIQQMIDNQTLPRFLILVGNRGSGRKTFAKEIVRLAQHYGYRSMQYVLLDVKIDTIRDMIKQAYKNCDASMFYIISDADNMSNAAKNALLKVTEEPPNDSYFIMTLEDENNTLETIRSRGTVFHMDRYTPGEIGSYFYDKYHANHGKDEEQVVKELCETPGDVDILVKMGIKEFYDYVELVVDNIAEVSIANSFKIASKVAIKEDAEGYDLRLFWKVFQYICSERLCRGDHPLQRVFEYGQAVGITSRYLQALRVKGVNRQMLVDTWIMEVREAWT